MDRVPFPWTEELKKPEPTPEPARLTARRIWPFLGALLALLLLAAWVLRAQKEEAKVLLTEEPYLVAVVSMLGLPKGSILEKTTLKEAPISLKSLTKAQRRQLVEAEDLPQVNGKLRTKKDIPPNKFLLWSDLEMLSPPSGHGISNGKIIFSKD